MSPTSRPLRLEQGFKRLAVALSVAGLLIGLVWMRYVYVRDEFHFAWDLWSYISYVVILVAWPWVGFYVIRWIVDGFRGSSPR